MTESQDESSFHRWVKAHPFLKVKAYLSLAALWPEAEIAFQPQETSSERGKPIIIYYLEFAGELCSDLRLRERSSRGWDFSKEFKVGTSKSSTHVTSITPPSWFCKMPSTWKKKELPLKHHILRSESSQPTRQKAKLKLPKLAWKAHSGNSVTRQ